MTDAKTIMSWLEGLAEPDWRTYHSDSEVQNIAKETLDLLKEQEAVVRCKDCKHATMTADGKMCKYCEIDTDDFGYQRVVYHDADWFCADGERKE